MGCRSLLTKEDGAMPIQYGLLTKEHLEALAPMLPEVRQAADENNVYAVGAVKDGCLCGVLVFRAGGELLMDIQYISVAETYRRQGIANGLIDFLCKSAWQSATAVCCTFAAADENEPLYRLFARRGDFTMAEGLYLLLSVQGAFPGRVERGAAGRNTHCRVL